jgi:hypothetical protein
MSTRTVTGDIFVNYERMHTTYEFVSNDDKIYKINKADTNLINKSNLDWGETDTKAEIELDPYEDGVFEYAENITVTATVNDETNEVVNIVRVDFKNVSPRNEDEIITKLIKDGNQIGFEVKETGNPFQPTISYLTIVNKEGNKLSFSLAESTLNYALRAYYKKLISKDY